MYYSFRELGKIQIYMYAYIMPKTTNCELKPVAITTNEPLE